MSKVPYTVNVDRYICTELSEIRDMIKTLDFSGLAASVERIQHHASAMEDALYSQKRIKNRARHLIDEGVKPKKFYEEIKKIVEDVD